MKQRKQSKKEEIVEFFVSPRGNDRWSGRRASPNASRSDGPFATIDRARLAVRKLKKKGELSNAVRVVLRGGTYELTKPLVFTSDDSGSPPATDHWQRLISANREVTYAAYPGETPILSGGRRITGWRETTVNRRRAWVAKIPEVARGKWNFTQLWVNGRRAIRPRLPKKSYFRIEKLLSPAYFDDKKGFSQFFTGQDRFRAAKGDLQAWRNVGDIEFVALHYWIESRIPFKSIDAKTRRAELKFKSRMRLTDDHTKNGAQYYVENIFEELKEPGQWYLDRPRGELYYIPRKGEKIRTTEIISPRLPQLMIVQGDLKKNRPVKFLAFEGLTFSHSEWVPGKEAATATPQAACHIPGALSFRYAHQCAVRDCTLVHLGSYALDLLEGSFEMRVIGNRITDLAAGGVKVWHTDTPDMSKINSGAGPDNNFAGEARRNIISDNEISDGGHRWRQAVGVLVAKCSGNQIVHNHIHDFDYTGISVGWTWGYIDSHGYGNIIEHNYIHDVGRGVLSDMGGIYLLGVAPGTRVRFNKIHDVYSRGYGGWGIYLDEGSSHVLVENNLVYRTKSQGFHQHYGRENIVRNNVFAFGGEGALARSRVEPHSSFTFTSNICLGNNGGAMIAGDWSGVAAVLDSNLYFDLKSKSKLKFGGGKSLRQWNKDGLDKSSLVRDPRFVNPMRGNFTLRSNSPARRVGFIPFELEAGPRKNLQGKSR